MIHRRWRGAWCAAWRRCASSAAERSDSYNFNWLLSVRPEFQRPFEVTHESMRALELGREQPAHLLAANLRRAFSGIVTGNVKDYGVQAIERHGPYELTGDPNAHAPARRAARGVRRAATHEVCRAASTSPSTDWWREAARAARSLT